jgi:acyl-CoA synthetase (AMP-forming)/AMP-acid ligase II
MNSRQVKNNLIDKLLLGAESQPESTLYFFLDSRGREYCQLTYASLLTAVQKLGRWLIEKTENGDRVAIQLPTGPEFVITFFACLYVSRVPVPLSSPNRKHNCEHYQRILSDCGAQIVMTDSTVQNLFQKEHLIESIKFYTFPSLENFEPLLDPIDSRNNEVAFLQYTSGSTSFPKGVIVSHENIAANQEMIQRTFGHSSSTVVLGWVPLFHDMGLIGSLFQPLYVGFSCYLMSPVTFIQRPKLWLKLISDKKITTTGGPNFAYELCIKRLDPTSLLGLSLSSWDVAYNGAEHVKLSTMQKFSELFAPYGFKSTAFLPCYGMAEATLIVSGANKSEEPLALTIPCIGDEVLDADALQKSGSIRTVVSNGQKMSELSLRITNVQTLKECSSHCVGEIWIAGPSITQGYWKKPDTNRDTFIYRDGVRFFRTGDLGFLDSDHRLYITGRLKDLIVIDGKNYYPQDIEEVVKLSHHALNDSNCAVFSISSASASSQKLVVVNEVIRQFWIEIYRYKDEIKEAVKTAVHAHFQLPVDETVLLQLNSIPKTTSGKIQRQKTKLMYLTQKFEVLDESIK